MSGDDFQTRYASVMDNMLRSAVAETTKLFETMVNDLKAEISRITKENEDLKSKCNEFENAKYLLTTNITENEVDLGPSSVSEKRDTGVQCDLVPLRTILGERSYHFTNSSLQSQPHQQGEHEDMEEQQRERCRAGEGHSPTFIWIKQEDGGEPVLVLKQECDEPALVCSQVLSEILGAPEGPPVSPASSDGGTTLLPKDETPVAPETPRLAGDSELGGAKSQASGPEPIAAVALPAVERQITETSTQTEVTTLVERPQVSVVHLPEKEEPSEIAQQLQLECETPLNTQLYDALQPHEDASSWTAPITEESLSEELEVGMAQRVASSQPESSSVRRRRGRPPKRANSCKSRPSTEAAQPSENERQSTAQLPVRELISLSAFNVASVQESANSSSRGVQKMKVSCRPVSAESSSKGLSSEKKRPQSQQVPMEMEKAIQSPANQLMPSVETVKTPSTELPKAPSVEPRERHASSPSLQDAMLLVEAMDAQASAHHTAPEDTVSSLQTSDNLKTNNVAPGQRPTSISPQTSASASSPQPPTVRPQSSFSLPTEEQTTAQPFSVSSQTTVSPNQQSTSVAQIIKAIVIPKQQYALIPSKTTASQTQPSTVTTSVQSLQQRPLCLTLMTQGKHLGNPTGQTIIIMQRPVSSSALHSIAALSPNDLSTVVSTVVAAQNKSLPPSWRAAGSPFPLSLPMKKTIVFTPGQSLSAVTSQTTATSDQSSTASRPKVTVVVPRQVPAVAPEAVFVTRGTPASVSSPPAVSSSKQSSVTMDTPTAPVVSAKIESHKSDNIRDNLESPSKTATVSKVPAVSTEACSNLRKSDSPVLMQSSAVVRLSKVSVPASTKEIAQCISEKNICKASNLSTKTLSGLLASPQLSPAVPKDAMPPSSSKNNSCLKAIPNTVPLQASALSEEPNAAQETPSPVVKSSRSIVAASAKDGASDVKISSSSSSVVLQEKPSTAPLKLSSVTQDTTSDPHLQMTKAQFLAQLAVSPVLVQQEALSSDALDTRTAHTQTSTDDVKPAKKDSIVARLRSHLRARLQAYKPRSKPKSITEPEPLPVSAETQTLAKDSALSPKQPKLDKDAATPEKMTIDPTSINPSSKHTTSEPIALSPKKPKLAEDAATPENMTLTPASISPRLRLTKDGASCQKTVCEATSVSPKRPRLSKDEPTPVSPRRSRLTKNYHSPKNDSSVPTLLRLANDTIGTKKTGESTDAKRRRLIPNVTSPKKNIRLANTKTLAKAAKAKKLAKMKKSNRSTSQNGVGTRHAHRETLKKATAKAVWIPPRMSANKTPLTRGRSLSPLPAKTDRRSHSQAQAPTSTGPCRVASPHQIGSASPNVSQTVRRRSPSTVCPSSPRTGVYRSSASLSPILVGAAPIVSPLHPLKVRRATPVMSPLQPLSVSGRLLKNQCGECGRILSSLAALESHVSLHTGRRPFSCTFCGKNFPDSKGLSRHGRVHRNGRIHVCSKCGKGFVYRFGLTKHVQMVHGRVKPFVCQICNKGFYSRRDVEAHIRVHTGEKPFQCHLCDKGFKRVVELNVHLRWHKGEKRHWCEFCGKGFLDFNNLKRHRYIHTGEKPHSCPNCSKKFTQSGHLKKHMKNVHKVD